MAEFLTALWWEKVRSFFSRNFWTNII